MELFLESRSCLNVFESRFQGFIENEAKKQCDFLNRSHDMLASQGFSESLKLIWNPRKNQTNCIKAKAEFEVKIFVCCSGYVYVSQVDLALKGKFTEVLLYFIFFCN